MLNVQETFPLFDTVAVTPDYPNLSIKPAGWYENFVQAGNAIDWQFFNQRNIASAGKEYTNLETRDQVAWPFTVNSLCVHFFAPSAAFQHYTTTIINLNVWNSMFSALWEADIPKHMGLEFLVNQDTKLRINALMPGSGGGPIVGGYGSLASQDGSVSPAASMPWSVHSGSQGNAHIKANYVFPEPVEIPVKAAIAVKLIPSEYCRRLLQALPGPHTFPAPNDISVNYLPTFYGIRVTLHGVRYVQQRGEAHAR
ncbi:MAG: hypothetical protein PHO67_08805 [Candidatus Omnitrophica bacterium]|nr:hypothetical protein [Candidatus Omnitrophota bacterium]